MNESAAIQTYMDLTGASEVAARGVFMFVYNDNDPAVPIDQRAASCEPAEKWLDEKLPAASVKNVVTGHYQLRGFESKIGPVFDNLGAAMPCARS